MTVRDAGSITDEVTSMCAQPRERLFGWLGFKWVVAEQNNGR